MSLAKENRSIYLDHAATTPPDPTVIDAMADCMQSCYANPSAAYSAAGPARRLMRTARETLSGMIGCDRNELFFTSGGTEANNWAFCGLEGRHVVISAIEHSSVLEAAAKQGCRITLVKPDQNGVIQPDAVEKAIEADTALISVQYVNNETGVLQPVSSIGRLARSRRILFHCDAVQAFGHIPFSVREIAADLLSVSAHKLYGPRGIGFLYIRSGVTLPPLLAGGGQENGRRSGTENVAAMEGFRVAAELASNDLKSRAERERRLLEQLIGRITGSIPGAQVLGGGAERAPGLCALLLPGLSSETAIARLDLQGIMVSGGAACAASSGHPSHVYRAMGLTEQEAGCILRFSPGRHTTPEEIDTAAEALITIWKEHHQS